MLFYVHLNTCIHCSDPMVSFRVYCTDPMVDMHIAWQQVWKAVYMPKDANKPTPVACKMLRNAASAEDKSEFTRECIAMLAFNHKHLMYSAPQPCLRVASIGFDVNVSLWLCPSAEFHAEIALLNARDCPFSSLCEVFIGCHVTLQGTLYSAIQHQNAPSAKLAPLLVCVSQTCCCIGALKTANGTFLRSSPCSTSQGCNFVAHRNYACARGK